MTAGRITAAALGGLVALLAAAPWWAGDGLLRLLIEAGTFLALAQLWNLLAGFGGVVSLGQHAYIGLGAYVMLALSSLVGLHPLGSLGLAALAGLVLALPVGLLVFRLSDTHFAIGTWVIAEIFRLSLLQVAALGAGSGMSLPARIVRSLGLGLWPRQDVLFQLTLLLVVAVTGGAWLLLRSRWGLALAAIRDNPRTAASSGIDGFRLKLALYVATAAATTLIGALIALAKLRVTPDGAFDISWTTSIIFIVVVGGIGTLEGPVVGTILFFVLRQYLADLGSWYLIVFGAVGVLTMLFLPHGIWGTLQRRWGLSVLSVRRVLP